MRDRRELAANKEQFQQRKSGEQAARDVMVQTDHYLPQFMCGDANTPMAYSSSSRSAVGSLA
jgi:hypothetical protein